ncbi:MAG: DUF4364 family protein [Clostridia bacterium]|nr:DUF4364 family protein [Clostridia bacterium]MBR3459453.1 DUF4364 family protein [Clostridia bacterium]
MAFFPEGQGRLKLLILYTIKKFRTPISREQLCTAIATVDDADFFDVSQLVAELEQEMYIIAVPARDQHLLYLTPKGEEMVTTFECEIPKSARDEVAGYADDNRERIKRSNCVFCDSLPKPDGSWILTLALLEREGTMFEMKIHMPDAKLTNTAMDVWLNDAENVYTQILKRLTRSMD